MYATLTPPAGVTRYAWLIRVAVLVLGGGTLLHIATLSLGRDWLPPDLARSAYLTLAVLSTLLAVGLWTSRSWARPGRGQPRGLHEVAAAYSTVAVLVHFGGYLTQRTELLRSFPDWFGLLVLGVQLLLAVALWWTSRRPVLVPVPVLTRS